MKGRFLTSLRLFSARDYSRVNRNYSALLFLVFFVFFALRGFLGLMALLGLMAFRRPLEALGSHCALGALGAHGALFLGFRRLLLGVFWRQPCAARVG